MEKRPAAKEAGVFVSRWTWEAAFLSSIIAAPLTMAQQPPASRPYDGIQAGAIATAC